ncbi:thrombospondin type-1 domain-containing protein 7A isoform X1 [Crotalus tigris]|uniref:thrombospondin type-1 domain-containing protein 7A isoform X1 n=1 Tax=Crotalus tigris TaxID=88082 RepID=UPI00192F99F5|nr:thrombospondin type-1 domain-containing protein 7A isoform X1 [Crotalus tigris]XP_039199734.1 thrombospondin type-1 domain-containing protein 7A isoform X1 [Crotalus tigris]XP_039199735.1 thrombospondin type-1 domain-containing protein 7A isoform X1 [Crotalus tigris]XP_039199736.1 thrombospondin type-1 domain-containing protein 7A isoform X1 [Crotalus tigris]XP_039199737.1 thrombospondin type-1 domain-containing protein 7A isoform X1 [Crotalus tigris]XP_039199738.1 thrombospondin type-1 dom
MEMAEQYVAFLGGVVVSAHPSKCLEILALLWFAIWVATAQSELETSVYLWKTGSWGRCMGDECGPGGTQTRAIWCAHVEGWTTLFTNCKQAERPDNQQNCFRVCDWHKELYDWQLGSWNQCQPILSKSIEKTTICLNGEEGIQRRDIICVQKSNGVIVEDAICEYFEPKPQLEQGCLIPCQQDCIVSDFSAWTECSKSCGKGLSYRFRHIVAPPRYGGSACPNLTEFQACSSSPCATEENLYSLSVGSWSTCSIPHLRHVRQVRKRGKNKEKDKEKNIRDPETRELIKKKRNHNRQNRQENKYWNIQIGYQTRQVMCTHRNGKTVALSFCQQEKLPITFQSCVITKECQVSEWSEWSPCSKTCFDMTSPKGYRTRTRTIKQFPIGNESECPNLEETEQCVTQGDGVTACITYGWRTTEWTECRIDPLLSQQDKRRGNQTSLCGGGIQTREVYCVQANENLLSYLNTLKEKKESQSQRTSKTSAAPLLSITFEITASKPVDWKLCTGPIPSTTQLCHIPCPIECEVSAWSAWGLCTFENCEDQQAKKGFKLRKRRIKNEPTGGTGNCPHLIEAIPCEEPSCYEWKIVSLDECIPDNEKDCGPGTQVPQVVCISSDGEEVDRQLCRDAIYPVPIVCEIPCPKDCALSTWSRWSSCSHTCSGKTTEGKQMRTRSVLAYAGEGGLQCPNISMLQETRTCNEHPCTVYHWQTGQWGQCIEDTSVSAFNSSAGWNGEATCAVGMQTRKVICVRLNMGQVPPKKCPENLRPETVRPCLLPCRKDCIVTPYSDWTLCPSLCQEGSVVTVSKQSRHRVILQLPANGGRDCPETLYEEKDCDPPPVCLFYRWKTHKWRRCQLVPWYVRQDSPGAQETCGPGLQARAITCRKQDGSQVDIGECLKYAGPLPPLTQLCQIPCQDDCLFTTWSKFSACGVDCGSVRTRKRLLIGKSKKKEKCKNPQLYPLIETQFCQCDKYNAQPVGNWSDCILPEGKVDILMGMKVQGDIKECGQGYRYQAMACYDQSNRLVETSRCNSHGYIEEACIIPCPSDCKLSEWSNWSRCSKSCGSGVKVRSKWLREKPYNGGRPCPKLDHVNQAQVYEVVPCHSDCGQYIGITEPWSVCKVTNVDLKENCGVGVQTRKVRCMQNTVDGPSDIVEDYLCDQEEMPIGARKCILPCPEDCVISEWGHWSRCSLPCNGSSVRERSAKILRLPQEGKACPSTMETEPCHLNKNCYHYDYNVTDWSTCQLSEKAVCGIGIKTRMLDCVRSDGKSVDLLYCEKLGLEKTWNMNTSCMVECPVNCQLSDWSLWSECSQACGLTGRMTRKRTVTQPFQGDGRPCPSQMEQFKPCPVKPCYRWQHSPWEECKVEDAQCGEGTRTRNIFCVVYDGSSDDIGKKVDEEYCGEIEPMVDGNKKLVLEEACTVPCPGDCYLKEWSHWSICQLTCINGEDLGFGGIQVRSRAVIVQDVENQHLCPDQALETRQCSDGHCYEYNWMASPWKGSSRTVWCQRSDGLNVTDTLIHNELGGCLMMHQPDVDRSCKPACSQSHSYCSETRMCVCEQGYTEVMSSNGTLEQCTRIPVVVIPTVDHKEDVKTSRAINPTQTPITTPGRGRTWFLQPFAPDGKLKTWVYGVAAGAFVLLIFVISMVYLACKKPKKPQRRQNNRLKPLTLAYDGDADM